jgi:uncharacterized membrane protein YbhN (UPF0104 family)
MSKRRNLVSGVVAAVLAALVYLQFRSWRGFDWATFWGQTDQVHILRIVYAIALTYLAFVIRAIRWKVFPRPVRRETTIGNLLAPTFIGFTGLAMFGRPGELIRPYLIARKEDLTFSSQLAVWAVERIFDLGAFALLLILAIFFVAGPGELRYYSSFRQGGFILAGLVVVLALAAQVVSQKGEAVADWVETGSSHVAADLRKKLRFVSVNFAAA